MEAMTLETAAALFRACDSAMLFTRGGRVVFANPAAVTAMGEDPTGQSAASVLPERLLKLQGKLGAASAKIRDRDAVVTVSRAGLYRAYSLRFLLPSARALPLPEPQWTALANLRLAAEECMADGSEQAVQILKSYYQLHRWFLNVMEKIDLSILFITHDIDEAILISDRIYLLCGKPGTIADEIVIREPKPRRSDFNLTDEFLQYKREIISKLC